MTGASSDVGEVMSTARTIRRFTDEPVEDVTLARCLEAARWAPSGPDLRCDLRSARSGRGIHFGSVRPAALSDGLRAVAGRFDFSRHAELSAGRVRPGPGGMHDQPGFLRGRAIVARGHRSARGLVGCRTHRRRVARGPAWCAAAPPTCRVRHPRSLGPGRAGLVDTVSDRRQPRGDGSASIRHTPKPRLIISQPRMIFSQWR